ncbi:MAG: hypothetical protein RLZZ220_392 [Pseudomonadota bacterium]|jgi:hypothetical protein
MGAGRERIVQLIEATARGVPGMAAGSVSREQVAPCALFMPTNCPAPSNSS